MRRLTLTEYLLHEVPRRIPSAQPQHVEDTPLLTSRRQARGSGVLDMLF